MCTQGGGGKDGTGVEGLICERWRVGGGGDGGQGCVVTLTEGEE